MRRENWIDWMKVILIYLMIVAHSGKISILSDTLICAFHMPAFFFISGYLHKVNPNGVSVMKNFKRLIIPTLFFNFVLYIWFIVKTFVSNSQELVDINEVVLKPLLGVFIYDRSIATPMCGVTWFLITLFFLKIIMDIILKWKDKYVLLLVTIGILIVAFWQKGNFDILYFPQRICVSLPFILAGFYTRKYELINKLKNKDGNYVIYLLLVVVIVYCLLSIYNGRVGIYSYDFGHSLFLFYLNAFLGIFIFVFLLIMLLNNKTSSLLVLLSNGTIVILCLHRFFLELCSKVSIFNYLEGFSLSLVVLVLLIPVIIFCNKYIPTMIGNAK